MSKKSSKPYFPRRKKDEVLVSDSYVYLDDKSWHRKRVCFSESSFSVTIIIEIQFNDREYSARFNTIDKKDLLKIAELIAG